MINKIIKFISEYEFALDKKEKKAIKTNDSKIEKCFDIFAEIKQDIEELLNIEIKKISVGEGNATITPWIGIDSFGLLSFTIIFYPKNGGIMINVCQSTDKRMKTKEGKIDIINTKDELVKKINSFTDIKLNNTYPPCYFDQKDWSRGACYAKSSPISIYLNGEDEIKNYFVSSLLEIENKYKQLINNKEFKYIYFLDEKNKSKLNLNNKENLFDFNDKTKFEFLNFVSSWDASDYIEIPKKSKKQPTIDRNKNKKRRETFADIGDIAEDLVVEFEKKLLIKNGLNDLSKKVKKLTTDGDGYDVLSYSVDDFSEKLIEVKGTTTDSNKFFISRNEWEFFKKGLSVIYFVKMNNYEKIKIIEFKPHQIEKSNLIPEKYSFKF